MKQLFFTIAHFWGSLSNTKISMIITRGMRTENSATIRENKKISGCERIFVIFLWRKAKKLVMNENLQRITRDRDFIFAYTMNNELLMARAERLRKNSAFQKFEYIKNIRIHCLVENWSISVYLFSQSVVINWFSWPLQENPRSEKPLHNSPFAISSSHAET